ncbi:amino acid adenylation domain-containing protein, partial [Paenibacillus sp. SER-28]
MTQHNVQLFALSQPQQRIWYTELVYPNRNTSTIITTVKIKGTVRIDALQQAMNRVIAQNDSFRIKITARDGIPYQYVEPFAAQSIETLQVTPEEAELWVSHHNAQPFPLLDSQLYRFVILRLGAEDTWFSFKMHHIISDGVTMEQAINEITGHYMNIVHGTGSDASAPANSYLDFIQVEQSYEQSDRYQKDKTYWTEKFADLPEVTGLKSYNPLTVSTAARRENYTLEHELYRGVTAFCEANNISIFTFFLAALYIYLHKMTGEQDLTVGTLYANRTLKKEKNTMGMFVSTVATRLRVEPESELLTFLQGVGKEQASILRHQRYPYNKIMQDLREQQSGTDIRRLFGVTIQYRTLSFSRFDEAVQQVHTDFCGDTVSDFDIAMIDMLDDDKLVLQLDYRTELFSEQEIARTIRQFLSVVEHMVKGPQKRIQELSLMSDEERAQIMDVFNATAVPYPHNVGIHELFEEQAKRTPDQTAVMFGNQCLTYRELNERANSLARMLQAQGVGPDKLVGLMVQRSLEMIVGLLAVLKAGGAYVPIDPEFPSSRIEYMLEDSKAEVLLTSRDLAEEHHYIANTMFLEDAALYQGESGNLEAFARPEHLAYVIYTSGSTGNPKGVMLQHRSVLNFITGMREIIDFEANKTILSLTTISFDIFVLETILPLLSGMTVVLGDRQHQVNPQALGELIAHHHIDMLQMTPSRLQMLMDHESGFRALRDVKEIMVGGEALPSKLLAALQEINGPRIYNMYGPTETTVWSTVQELTHAQDINIGRPIANTQIYIMNASGELQPVGVPGELCIAGEGLARGYWNREELTAEKFVDNPFAGGKVGYERMYRTGDLARWSLDGNIEYLGRMDHQVKIRGYRIELGEIESQLLQVESVREAVVVAHTDETGQKQLVAYYVASQELGASELRSELGRELPSYMVPSYFIQLDQMPLTPNGKIDRKSLPAPEGSLQSGADYVEPRTATERALAAVWQSVLGVPTVGMLDNFFDLGGDSIKAIQIVSRAFQAGYKLDMKDLLRYPTVAALAPHMHEASHIADQGEVSGETALLPIQHGFFEQEQVDAHHFNQAVMLHREQGFDEAALRQALIKLTEHHDALRMVFRKTEQGFQAWNRGIQEGELYHLDVLDFRDLTDAAILSATIEAKATEIQNNINLSEGPLVNLGLFRCIDGDHLLVAIHHLVVDGVSWRILLEDLATGYEQSLRGESVRLPNKTDSFRLWADQLSAYASSGALEYERAYWEQIEQAGKSQASLPKDYTRKSQAKPQLRDDRTLTVAWTVEETEQFLKQAHRAYNTEANDLLLTALGTAIQEWAGIRQVLVNVEGHGREAILPDVDITRTVGWFTSQFPVVLDMGEDRNVGRRVKNVKEGLRRLPHKGIGYGILRYLADEEGEAAFVAEPEISFNYLGQFDQDLKNNAFRMSPYSIGASISDTLTKRYALDINGMITDGALELTISYSNKMFMKKSIKKLADLLQESLREVLAHCVEKELPELTPSDLSFQGLTAGELDHIVEQTAAAGELENIYSLTPMQKGILFHGLMEPQSGAYFEQATFDLQGSFQVEAFAESLNQLVDRHQIFRTNFYSGWNEQPLQVVYRHKHAGFRFEDVRSMEQGEQDAYIADFAERDKAEGFNFSSGELMRVSILRTGEESYRFVWSFHHILMDGWCLFLVVGEAFNTYFAILEDRKPELVPVTPYSEYIEWLDRQDNAEAERFWSDYFAGFEQQTVLPQVKQLDGHAKEYEADKLSFTLDCEVTERMNKLVKQKQVTVNTLLQAAW